MATEKEKLAALAQTCDIRQVRFAQLSKEVKEIHTALLGKAGDDTCPGLLSKLQDQQYAVKDLSKTNKQQWKAIGTLFTAVGIILFYLTTGIWALL